MDCPDCGGATTFVRGRQGYWCNACMRVVATGTEKGESDGRAEKGRDTAMALARVLPVGGVGVALSGGLLIFGLGWAAAIAVGLTAVAIWLLW